LKTFDHLARVEKVAHAVHDNGARRDEREANAPGPELARTVTWVDML
jgi:hypothetical protein